MIKVDQEATQFPPVHIILTSRQDVMDLMHALDPEFTSLGALEKLEPLFCRLKCVIDASME